MPQSNIDILISELLPYVTDAIWIGKMNHLGRFEKNADPAMKRAIGKVRYDQADSAKSQFTTVIGTIR